jgi:GNAT superfamily N-acetyltransferase
MAEAYVASWRTAYAGLVPQEMLDELSVEGRTQQWRRQVEDPLVTTLVACDPDEQIVGLASLGPSRDGDADTSVGELYAIYLHPGAWGTGAGATLHASAVAELARTFTSATLWVLAQNTRARAFYAKHGWQLDGAIKKDRRNEAVLDEVRYRLAINDQ